LTGVYLYKNLKALRKSKGWTQDEMLSVCGITRSTWSNYENGQTEPDIQTIVKVSGVFGVSIDDLILKDLSDIVEDPRSRKKFTEVEGPENVLNDPENIQTWTILTHLRRIEEKLDQLRDLNNNNVKKSPDAD
jgi:transcriptional regulator with XRE-family HTH domain